MLRPLKLIPNQVTAVRIIFTAIIWGMIVSGVYDYIGIGLVICFISDVLDGQLARRLHQATEFGARFDSLADNILIPSALVWLLIFRPEIYLDNPILFPLAIATYICSLVISHVRARKPNVSQLYLSKLSGLTQYIFGIYTFITGHYCEGLFYLTIGTFFISSLESLILQFTRVEVNKHLTSILFIWPYFNRLITNLSFFIAFSRIFSVVYGAHPSASKNTDIIP